MTLACPNCLQPIPETALKPQKTEVLCPTCHAIFSADEIKAGKAAAPSKPEPSTSPPPGSKISMETGLASSISLSLARQGFTRENLARLVGTGLFLIFVTIWSALAFLGSWLLLVFSIPIWLLGMGLLIRALNRALGSQQLIVTRDGVTLIKKKVFGSKRIDIPFQNLKAAQNPVVGTRTSSNIFSGKRVSILTKPQLMTEANPITFFEHAPTRDKEWIVDFLDSMLTKQKDKGTT